MVDWREEGVPGHPVTSNSPVGLVPTALRPHTGSRATGVGEFAGADRSAPARRVPERPAATVPKGSGVNSSACVL